MGFEETKVLVDELREEHPAKALFMADIAKVRRNFASVVPQPKKVDTRPHVLSNVFPNMQDKNSKDLRMRHVVEESKRAKKLFEETKALFGELREEHANDNEQPFWYPVDSYNPKSGDDTQDSAECSNGTCFALKPWGQKWASGLSILSFGGSGVCIWQGFQNSPAWFGAAAALFLVISLP